MLLELSIKNFAIIDDLKVSFTKGLNLLTGETGAGKSIIIEALGTVLGGRGSKDLIRTGKDKAVLQALFLIEDTHRTLKTLNKYGIDIDRDGLLIITREISAFHPSISRVNGRTITLTILNEITSNLVDIFAQHEHQSLLDISNHKRLIDTFGDEKFKNLKGEIKLYYDEYIESKNRLSKINLDSRKREREIDLLKFQIEEIEDANLKDEDDREIEDEFNRLNNIKDIAYGIGQISESLQSSNFDEFSIIDIINKDISIFSDLVRFDSNLSIYLNRLKEINFELQDINKGLVDYIDRIDVDGERLQYLEERINVVNRLKKKYGNSIQAIYDFKKRIDGELEDLLNHKREIKILDEKIKKLEDKLYNLSMDLSHERHIIAESLEAKISKELLDLNMGNVTFKVDFQEKAQIGSDGIDHIEFLISTNPGEDLKSVSKIVSGGEMSRIMLGFKSILAKYDGITTMIFDEIDTGISGRTAQIVGEKISEIAKDRQVISITHLPQIAALADSHYFISKKTDKGKTVTTIKRLEDEERVEEMARLLGGVDVTNTTLDHAREMISMSKKFKNKI
ncbi:DNA repair protein RecN [Tissierellaceae bacterium HCP3S3_D8]